MKTDKIDCNSSFNSEFCIHLEFAISKEFTYSNDKELRHFWCDGVNPEPFIGFENNKEYLDYKNIHKTKRIDTIAWTGMTGQTIYQMGINLGEESLEKYKNGKKIIDCIPKENTVEWIEIDTENKTIIIDLK